MHRSGESDDRENTAERGGEEPRASRPFEFLLDKYAGIWAWSIIFGAATTIAWQIVSLSHSTGRWGVLSGLIVIPLGFAALLTLKVFAGLVLWSKWLPQESWSPGDHAGAPVEGGGSGAGK